MSAEETVAEHYRHGALEEALLKGLAAAGKNIDKLTPDDLAPADEFHLGGRQATVDFATEFAPAAGTHLLDIGCGLGGPSRYFAQHYRCRVTGVDLSDEYIAVAGSLSLRVGLSGQVVYQRASATELPFPDATFDGTYMQHVGMNIPDKARLFREVRRVLKPRGQFGIYDIMRIADGPIVYPLPWASSEKIDFTATPLAYRTLLAGEGFEVIKERDRREFALNIYRALKAKTAKGGGPPAFGLQIVMGTNAAQKISNMFALFERGTLSPVEMICRRA
jgi:ubiquinone/menaquinone biosynthesis C-methylase UbiE